MLVRTALLGTLAFVALDAWDSLALASGAAPAAFLAAVVAAWVVTKLWAPEGHRALTDHPQLLVPLGIRFVAENLLGLLWLLPFLAFMNRDFPELRFGEFAFVFTWALLLKLVVDAAYAAWTTTLLLRSGAGECAPAAAARGIVRWLPRVLLFLTFGHAVALLPLLLLVALHFLGVRPGAPALVVILGCMALWALAWNVMTAALLPLALDEETGFRTALRRGVRASLRHRRRLAGPVLAQLVVLGVVAVNAVAPLRWQVHPLWTGGYEDRCRWYLDLAITPAPLFESILVLLYGALAIAVKWTVIERVWREEARP